MIAEGISSCTDFFERWVDAGGLDISDDDFDTLVRNQFIDVRAVVHVFSRGMVLGSSLPKADCLEKTNFSWKRSLRW